MNGRTTRARKRRAASWTHLDVEDHPGRELLWDGDGVALSTRQAQAVRRVSGEELQRDHPHPNQVTAVDPLVTLGDDGLDALRHSREPLALAACDDGSRVDTPASASRHNM